MGAVTSKALLPLADTSALRVQLQSVELPLMERIYGLPRRQDRIEVVTLPLHPTLVKVATVLHRDEPRTQEDSDTFHCGVPGHADLSGDGVVAGMAGVCPAILDQQQIGVDHERRWRKIQQKNLAGQSEKLFAVSTPMVVQICLQR